MDHSQTEARAIEAQAWNCDEWPEWLHKIVDETCEVAYRLDMSAEQAHAYAVLAALAAKDAELARRDMQLEASAKVALDLSAQLAEANKALDAVFDDTQARTRAGMVYGINGHPTLSPATLNIVAQARFAARRAREAQGASS